MRVNELATSVVSIAADATVMDAAQLMWQRRVGLLVVVEPPSGRQIPIGVLTDRDIVVSVIAPGIDPGVIEVGDVMTSPVRTCNARDDLFDALRSMQLHGLRRLPVLDGEDSVCGLLSIDDIIAAIGPNAADLVTVLYRERADQLQLRR
jgi:CBS domain-containing protein